MGSYFVRPEFNPQRADMIVGPLSLVELEDKLEHGTIRPGWLFVNASSDDVSAVRRLPEEAWAPVLELPAASCYVPPRATSGQEMAGGAGEGCLKVLMWSVMGVLALFAVASAIVYASCHGFMRP